MPDTSEIQAPLLVKMRGITKRFGRVRVLDDVRLDIHPAEVHVLAGENGAGKSTLIKILAGIYPDHRGHIEFEGRPIRPTTPIEAERIGIAVIHQELSLVPSMTVADNIFLGRHPTLGGVVNDGRQRREARRLLNDFGLKVSPRSRAGELPVGTQQMIEIAKALSRRAKVIVMDEPTSSLNAPEVERLFEFIADLKSRGCGIVYITHKMEEIQRIADRITVLRDGEFIGSSPAEELPMDKLIEWMVGRRIDQQFPRHAPHPGDVRLRLKNVSVYPKGRTNKPAAEGVSLEVRAGEIVGLGGLQGSGASELLSGIYGAYGLFGLKGRMELDARATRFTGPSAALRNGVALVPADRKTSGLVRSMSITANIAMADGPRVSPLGWRLPGRERRAARTQADELNLVASSLRMEAGQLSGGNQQKVVLGKFLQTRPRLLLLDEPTRGVDVGAKREIYNLMNQWSAEGIAILLITSEMPELLAMSDRIVVMHRGRVTARFETSQASPQDILAAAMGQEYKEATLP